MSIDDLTEQKEFVVLYHGSTVHPSNDTSLTDEKIIKNHEKEKKEHVILRLTKSNLTIQTTTNKEIFNVSYNNISNYMWFQNLSPYFGISITNIDNSYKKYYHIFSIDTTINNHKFHQNLSDKFQFDCLPGTQLLIKECQQFPSAVEGILEAILLYKNYFTTCNSNDVDDDNKTTTTTTITTTSSSLSSLNDIKINDPSQGFDENIIKCQKRKSLSPLFFDRMSGKRASLVEGLFISGGSQYFNKSTTLCKEGKTITSTNLSSKKSTFCEVLDDPILKECFMKFLTEQYCQENLSFYLIVERYQCLENDTKRSILGCQIVERFINDDSDEQINIDNNTRKEIINNINNNVYPKTLFDGAFGQIEDMLRFDLMPRFLKSLNQPKIQDNSDKENCTRRKLTFNAIKNKLLKLGTKNSIISQDNLPRKVTPPAGEHNKTSSLIVGTFRRSFVKPRPTLGYLFRNTTLSRSL